MLEELRETMTELLDAMLGIPDELRERIAKLEERRRAIDKECGAESDQLDFLKGQLAGLQSSREQPQKPFYTEEEAGAILEKTPQDLMQFVKDGKLRQFRDGGVVYYKADEIERLRPKEPHVQEQIDALTRQIAAAEEEAKGVRTIKQEQRRAERAQIDQEIAATMEEVGQIREKKLTDELIKAARKMLKVKTAVIEGTGPDREAHDLARGKQLHARMKEFIAAGFTRDEAFELVIATVAHEPDPTKP